ncbi:MAG: hypothetical protein CMI52_04210 [Parcubacteria group bacterium]|mgnify:CR=1 FL=1|nr:hypothetical protein [Parcubacteria group bacterium]|tara:strand:+ start:1075 stop:1380 length:306 start_codon:yes stop_codon:yes gene_type:complete
MKTLILIPTYNEAENIASLMEAIPNNINVPVIDVVILPIHPLTQEQLRIDTPYDNFRTAFHGISLNKNYPHNYITAIRYAKKLNRAQLANTYERILQKINK